MKTWWKKLSGAALAAALTILLNGRAYALDPADTADAETPPQIEQPAVQSADPDSLQTNDPEPTETPAPTLTVAGEAVDLTGDCSGSGWRYDAQDQSVVLINYDGAAQSITTTASDITIKAAGLNRMESLAVDGDIHLIGTGILLVDKIEMAEGKSFILQPNKEIYGEDGGSVAVFLKQDDGTYMLVNGSVSGVLDEEYTLPAGVTLVVPDGSELRLQSLAIGELLVGDEITQVCYSTKGEDQVAEQLSAVQTAAADAGNDPGCVDFSSTTAQLTIPETAKLILENAAKLVMNRVAQQFSKTLIPKLTVLGELELNGSISGGTAVLAGADALSGSGSFQDAIIDVCADQAVLTASDSTVVLAGGTVMDTLILSGSSTLRFSGNVDVGELALTESAAVTATASSPLTSDGSSDTLNLDELSGEGTITYQSGNVNIGKDSSAGAVEESASTGGAITHRAGTDTEETCVVGPGGLLPIGDSGAEEDNGAYAFPVVQVVIERTSSVDGSVMDSVSGNGTDAESSFRFDSSQETISLGQLKKTMLPTQGVENWIEIYYVDDSGTPHKLVLTEADDPGDATISASHISLIRTVAAKTVQNGIGGGISTSTNTSFTGSGVLGSSAGSVSGGNRTPILFGTGITKPEQTDPDDDPSGEGGKEKDKKPDRETDPQEPEAGAAIRIWVNQTGAEAPYVLHMEENGVERPSTGGRIEARMPFRPAAEMAGQRLYVVFRDSSGALRAFAARYDAASGELVFETELLGEFVVVTLAYSGEEFSADFYAALAELEEVRKLR